MASRLVRYNALIIQSGSGSRLPPMPTIRDIIKIHKLTALKQLSQNFIMDERLTARIVKQSGKMAGHHVLEVGPGPGSITRSILRRGPKQLVVVEKDRRFIPTMDLLAAAVKPSIQMDIYRDDILRFKVENAFPDTIRCDWGGPPPPVHLVGNLPFAISTRLLINWLRDVSLKQGAWIYGRTDMVLTFQKEVGERIIAPIKDPQRCRLSVMSQIWTKPEVRFLIPGKAFVPKPDVDVAVVRLVPLREPLTTLPFDLVEKVMRYIFSMRQKTVKNCIGNLYPTDMRAELINRTFQVAEVNPMVRSFELSNEECLRLADGYSDILKEYPHIDNFNYRARKPKAADVETLQQSDICDDDDTEDLMAENENDDDPDDYLKY